MHCIAHGIGCAAEIAGAITNAVSRIIHKMAVADHKSRTGGGRTAVNYLIGMLFNVGGTGALLWAKQIIGRLGVFRPDTLEAWYAYFSTGEAQHFFALMQTLPSAAQ